uniref:Uncharacterized protein n=1 Tax=Fundulus heteroclitus TaxID=8078 RepID=A0A146R7X8_FUNHE
MSKKMEYGQITLILILAYYCRRIGAQCNTMNFTTQLFPGFTCANGTQTRFSCCVANGVTTVDPCPPDLTPENGFMCFDSLVGNFVCVTMSSICGTSTNANVARYRAAVIAPSVLIALFGATGLIAGLASIAPLLTAGGGARGGARRAPRIRGPNGRGPRFAGPRGPYGPRAPIPRPPPPRIPLRV